MRKRVVQAVIQQMIEYRAEVLLDEYGHMEEVIGIVEELGPGDNDPELIEVEYEIETEGIIPDPREVE
jgi:hypothetical protein